MPKDQSKSENDLQRAALQDLFDETLLGSGYIQQFTFDLYHNTLTILVRVTWTDTDIRDHHVVFNGVRALYFQDELNFPLKDVVAGYDATIGIPWSWAGYKYYDRPVVLRLVDPPHGLERVGMTMNFALDVLGTGNGVLLIAASDVSIDDQHFHVGVPPKPEQQS